MKLIFKISVIALYFITESVQRILEENVEVNGPDCHSLLQQIPGLPSGIYDITIASLSKTIPVYCDMDTTGGGWTVFQRRIDGSELFYRPWLDYANGFGTISREFWLGNDNIAALTSANRYTLRIDLGDWEGEYRYAEYNDFIVSPASDKYRIWFGSYSGTAGDSLTYHRGHQFTTYDQDNDGLPADNCASLFHGAHWHNSCLRCNPNGQYNSTNTDGMGIYWLTWYGNYYSMRFFEMKIRPATV